jgi:tetratricopeptide (TPR) repeat protein
LGKPEDGIRHYQEALRLDPNYANAHYNLGAALEGEGRITEAIEQYQQALKLRPDMTAASDALAQLRAGQ